MAIKMSEREWRYATYGPSLHDALEAMLRERDKVQKAIDAISRCMATGLLGDPVEAEPATEDHQ